MTTTTARTLQVPEGLIPVLLQITPRTNGAKKVNGGEIVGRCHLEILEPVQTKDGRTRYCPVTAGSVTVFKNDDGSFGLPLTPASRNHRAIYVDAISELGQKLVESVSDAGEEEAEPAE